MTNNSVSPAILLAVFQEACVLMHLASYGLLLSESDDFRIPKLKVITVTLVEWIICKAFQVNDSLAPSICC